jgi:hypothetical protein
MTRKTNKQKYTQRKEQARADNARQAAAGQDIGAMPPVKNPARRAAAAASLRVFCETYFPGVFYDPWSPDHLTVIARLETTIRHGGQFALAMPRGSGKSALCEAAALWAILYGYRGYVALIAGNQTMANESLENIKTSCETNELLLEDFPEVLYPIHCLERIVNRSKGQKYLGKHTYVRWKDRQVQFPMIPGSKAAGAILATAGMESAGIRGLRVQLGDGTLRRPDLAIIDDPQTDESAVSVGECEKRERLLTGAVLGMAGPDRRIAAIMPCTVIRKGDLADTILDRAKHPEWHGQRMKLVYVWPRRKKDWDRYAELLRDELTADGDGTQTTAWYAQRRARMDRGCRVGWESRYNRQGVEDLPAEISAIQFAYDILILRGEAAFAAEYQNEPILDEAPSSLVQPPDVIAARVSGIARGKAPLAATHLVAFIDVHKEVLYWMVAAWADGFTGSIIDYGTHPDQGRRYFTQRDARSTLGRAAPGAGQEGALKAGLDACIAKILVREWRREDGAAMRIERCLIDANWGQATDLVHAVCRTSIHAATLSPSHGKYVGASSRPFSEYTHRQGDRAGPHWRLPSLAGRHRVTRYVLIDTNFWKSFVHARFAVAPGDPGALTLYGRPGTDHRLLADHLTSEKPVSVVAGDRVVDEWKLPKGDNHWLDCLVGCAVAASVAGTRMPGETAGKSMDGGRRTYSREQLAGRRRL